MPQGGTGLLWLHPHVKMLEWSPRIRTYRGYTRLDLPSAIHLFVCFRTSPVELSQSHFPFLSSLLSVVLDALTKRHSSLADLSISDTVGRQRCVFRSHFPRVVRTRNRFW